MSLEELGAHGIRTYYTCRLEHVVRGGILSDTESIMYGYFTLFTVIPETVC